MVQVKSPDGMRVEEKVQKKNPLADVMEAAEYAFWGGGEGASLTRLPEGNKPKPKRYTGSSGSVFSNERRRIG